MPTPIETEAQFGVNQEYQGIDELAPIDEEQAAEAADVDASVVTIDENGVTEAQDSIASALEEAGASTPSTFSDISGRGGNIVVALDPGHDSTHAGASAFGLREEDLTLKIANYCKEELETYAGVSVFMTRTSSACPHPGRIVRKRHRGKGCRGSGGGSQDLRQFPSEFFNGIQCGRR